MDELTTPRAITLYVGALLGPSVLLMPGLAVELAGPASIVAWGGLLVLSGLLATTFAALGRRLPGSGGAAGFAGAAFGPRAERAVAVCFLGGAVLGAPVVCLIGASYAARPFGGGPGVTTTLAAVLLVLVVAGTVRGGRSSARLQLGLVGVLVVLVTVAVVAALPHTRAANWTPFAPHGWAAVGSAGSVLMLAFVGWEAVSPMTARLRDPGRQLPRIVGTAFVVTAVVYLALAATTIGVLGTGSTTAVADLLRVGVGPVGTMAAAVTAVALTLAATNAYLSGAAAMATAVSGPATARRLPAGVAGVGLVLLIGTGAGWWTTTTLVALPTALFLAVYLVATAAGVRLLAGRVRVAAVASCLAVVVVVVLAGAPAWAAVLIVAVPARGASRRRPVPREASAMAHR